MIDIPKIAKNVSTNDDFEDAVTTVAVFLKQLIEKAKKEKGLTEEYITACLCAMQNYALGSIPES